jgi:hypothetical protein
MSSKITSIIYNGLEAIFAKIFFDNLQATASGNRASRRQGARGHPGGEPDPNLPAVSNLITPLRLVPLEKIGMMKYLDEACADDVDLRGEVESLLACQAPAEDFIENALYETAPAGR